MAAISSKDNTDISTQLRACHRAGAQYMSVTISILHIMISCWLRSFAAKCSSHEDNMGVLYFDSLRAQTLGTVWLFVEGPLDPG